MGKQQDLTDIVRINNGLYIDAHKRTLIVNFKNNTVFVLPKEKERIFNLFRTRYVVALMLLIIIMTYTKWYIAFPVALLCLAIMEYSYHNSFLSSLDSITNAKLPKPQTDVDVYVGASHKANIKRLIASILLTLLIIGSAVYFTFIKNNNIFELNINNALIVVLSVVFCFISVRIAVITIKALSSNKG